MTIISSGLLPVLTRIMTNFLGEKAKDIEIVANNGKVEDRNWKVIWRDDSIYGNDKSKSKFQLFLNIILLFVLLISSTNSIGQGS